MLDSEPTSWVRLGLNILLCWFLYQGKNWARITSGILFGLGGILGLIMFLALPFTLNMIFLGAMAAFYSVCSILLLWYKPLKAHFQRNGDGL
jgi:hypothetical protein